MLPLDCWKISRVVSRCRQATFVCSNVARAAECQRGYSGVRLLAVIAVMAVVAAAIGPAREVTEAKFSLGQEQGVRAAEWSAVQRAIDLMIMDRKLTAVTAGVDPVQISEATIFAPAQSLTEYLSDPWTKYCYTWEIQTQTEC